MATTSSAVHHLVGAARRRTLANLIGEQLSVGLIAAMAGAILLLLIGTQILDWWWPLVLFLGGAGLSLVNGALESWARAAATELPQGWRLNVVSPSLVEGTPAAARAAFPGFEVVSGHRVALAYLRCLSSGINGQVLRV